MLCDSIVLLPLQVNEPSTCEAGYSDSFWKHPKCLSKLSKQQMKTDGKLLLILNVLLRPRQTSPTFHPTRWMKNWMNVGWM